LPISILLSDFEAFLTVILFISAFVMVWLIIPTKLHFSGKDVHHELITKIYLYFTSIEVWG
jgi:hypothetical protein